MPLIPAAWWLALFGDPTALRHDQGADMPTLEDAYASGDLKRPKLSPDPADTPESKSQFVVALAIVAGLVTIAIGLIIAGLITGQWAILSGGIGTIIGALATALNAPTGMGKLLNAAKQQPQDPPPKPDPQG